MSAATPSAAGTGRRGHPALRILVLRVVVLTVPALLGGLLAAGPAAAVDDSTRPDARVTHGPSCRPGGVVVEVVAGTVPYAVTLATTRAPDGEDAAELRAGGTAVLRSGGVAWGETIDGWLEYRALDGSGAEWVDELAGYTFTRPAEEDCAAITAPAAPATVPGTAPRIEPSAPAPAGDGPAGDVPVAPEGAAEDPAPEPDGAPGAGPDRAIEPGGSVPPSAGEALEEEAVVLASTATAPVSAGREQSTGPLLVAAVALASAVAALVGTLGVPGLRRRRPTPGA